MNRQDKMSILGVVLLVLLLFFALSLEMSRSEANHLVNQAIEDSVVTVSQFDDLNGYTTYKILKSDFDNDDKLSKALEIKEVYENCEVVVMDDSASY